MRLAIVLLVACTSSPPPAPPPSPPPPAPVHADAATVSIDAATPADAAEPAVDAAPPPIACKTDDDCWTGDDGRTPIARPKALRGKKVRACKDSEQVPACKNSVCVVVGYKC